jgi:hypothetical protein
MSSVAVPALFVKFIMALLMVVLVPTEILIFFIKLVFALIIVEFVYKWVSGVF